MIRDPRYHMPRSQLELREEGSGPRYYLDGQPIHAGAGLEMLFAGDVWLEGRYEWNYDRENRPLLYFNLGGPWEGDPEKAPPEVVIRIPPEAILRWPRRGPFGER